MQCWYVGASSVVTLGCVRVRGSVCGWVGGWVRQAAGGDQWEPPDELFSDAAAVCAAIARCLAPGGVFLQARRAHVQLVTRASGARARRCLRTQVSFSQPHFRRPFFRTLEGWSIETHKIGAARHVRGL